MCYSIVTAKNNTKELTETEEPKKRKTTTSNEVKQRYIKKTYERYLLTLRKVEDADLINRIEKEKASGLSTSEAIKKLIK
jgi:hypothetical protein